MIRIKRMLQEYQNNVTKILQKTKKIGTKFHKCGITVDAKTWTEAEKRVL